MHERVRVHDWAATPLGPIAEWPPNLRALVDVLLGTGFPTLLLWGDAHLQIYNDPYRLLITEREQPLGVSHHESWPDHRAYNSAIFERVMRGETIVTYNAPITYRRPNAPPEIWISFSYSPVHDDSGSIAGIWISFIETTEQVRAEAMLRESEAQLAQILNVVPVGVSLFDTTGRIVRVNPEMRRLFGDRTASRVASRRHSMFDREGRPLDPDQYPSARALRGERVPPETELALDIEGARRWLRIGAVPFMRDGDLAGGVVIAHDATKTREYTDHMKVLVAELQHRTRNLIAVVRSLADKTLRGSASLDDFSMKYRPRLAALARVQGLLAYLPEGERVTFDALLRAELTAHAAFEGGARVTCEGPAGVRLRSSTVQTLALALHELATNAVKYGALSQPAGHLAVRWRVEPAEEEGHRRLHVEWRESGVVMPEVDTAAPDGGYGRELIERVLPYQLKAQTTYELGSDGVRCTIALLIARGAPAQEG